jgi:hypothetical protein
MTHRAARKIRQDTVPVPPSPGAGPDKHLALHLGHRFRYATTRRLSRRKHPLRRRGKGWDRPGTTAPWERSEARLRGKRQKLARRANR